MKVRARASWFLLWLFLAISSRAAECPAIVGGGSSLLSVDAAERLQYIRESLAESARQSRLWMWGWGTAFATISTGELLLAPLTTPEKRIDNWVSAAAPLVGIADLFVHPPSVIWHHRQLESDLVTMANTANIANIANTVNSAVSPHLNNQCKLLAHAEDFLLADAKNELKNHSLLLHAGNLLYNLGVGLFLALAFHHPESGAFTAISGMAIGEIEINTRPSATVKALARYRTGDLTLPRREPFFRFLFGPLAERGAYGISGTMIF